MLSHRNLCVQIIERLLVLIVLLLMLEGCGFSRGALQKLDSPWGVVFYREDDSSNTDLGAFYYYDFHSAQVTRLTSSQQEVYGRARSIHWSSTNEQFVYSAGYPNDTEIFTVDSSGREHQQLTQNHDQSAWAYWSPDGQHIAFLAREGNAAEQRAYIMNGDGTGRRPLLNGSKVLSDGIMQWSPDGSQIAVLGSPIDQQPQFLGQDLVTNIYIVEVKSGNVVYELSDGTVHLNTSWSPDGRYLAYAGHSDDLPSLYIWDLDAGSKKKITDIKEVLAVDWSPDGKWLAFLGGPLSERLHLFVMRPDGSDLINLTPHSTFVTSQGVEMWSPDSKCLLYSQLMNDPQETQSQWDLFIVNISSGANLRLTNDNVVNAAGSWVSSGNPETSCQTIFEKNNR